MSQWCPCPWVGRPMRQECRFTGRACTSCVLGQCLAEDCEGCGARHGQKHDDECRASEAQQRAVENQTKPPRAA